MADRILRCRTVLDRVGFGRATLYDLVKRNLFPRPVRLVPGGRAVGWVEAEVEGWLADRIAEGRADADDL